MHPRLASLVENIRRVIIGKEEVVRLAVTALLADGHLLIEDAPGLGKTVLARSIAQSIDATFHRIQFTPDLLPTDVTGVSIYHPKRECFEFAPGPVFAQVLLADEINRTSPRTQSSLLEAMEERQVTVEGRAMPLPELFFVVATQNPVELEGTFPLPEAQIDRFLMRLRIGYPDRTSECAILRSQVESHPLTQLGAVLRADEVVALRNEARQVPVSPEIEAYIVALARATREEADVRLGVSPRGSLALMRASQALALLGGERFVTPDDVQAVARPVLAHRLLLDPHSEQEPDARDRVIERVLARVPVPVLPAASSGTARA